MECINLKKKRKSFSLVEKHIYACIKQAFIHLLKNNKHLRSDNNVLGSILSTRHAEIGKTQSLPLRSLYVFTGLFASEQVKNKIVSDSKC